MPSAKSHGLAAIRKAALKRAGDTSQREVAKEIGMSLSGLQSFLRGASPYAKVRRKLVAWHVRRVTPGRRSSNAIGREDAQTAISFLALYIKQDDREDARGRMFLEIGKQLAEESDVSASLRTPIR
jgi:hypothetical protein